MEVEIINLFKQNSEIKFSILFVLSISILISTYSEANTFEQLRARAQAAAKKRESIPVRSKMRENYLHIKESQTEPKSTKEIGSKAYMIAFAKAENGDKNAQFALAGMFYQGLMVPRDYKRAMKWYEKAANQGHIKAQFNLAYIFFDGRGVSKDHNKALKWFKKAAENGDSKATLYLGILYDEMGDDDNSFYWYSKAAEEGYPKAQYRLAHMYRSAKGCKRDMKKYITLLQKAASESEAHAQYDLGIAYLKGEGLQKDKNMAYHWLQKAYLNGEPKAKSMIRKIKNR